MLRFLSAGESHGQALVITLDGMPAGLDIDIDALNAQLRRRQGGYGRGRRMAIESDRAEILAGVRHGRTTGAPIAMLIRNRDWVNWQQTMYVEREMPDGASGAKKPEVTRPRPGHADLAGAIKYGHEDIRDVLERASARETASRVAAGSLARQLLGRFGIRIASHVSSIGDVALPETRIVSFEEARAIDEDAPLRCVDTALQQKMIAVIDAAKPSRRLASASARRSHSGQALASMTRFCRRRPKRTRLSARPTGPAASRGASPTARTCASAGS